MIPGEQRVEYRERRGGVRVGQVNLEAMPIQMTLTEAKANLSELLDAALAGEEVVLSRHGRPMARLVPIVISAPRKLGFLHLTPADEIFDPLRDAERDAWG